ncbi:MAG TPA: acyclic terpene utilization AtuA family protein, partial [Acidimicrobiia bacterium]|nr:acyclic terpene utilization AtuA family protein [Acidimicrobiia bacterium]
AQLLSEIGSPAYATPDVVARFDTIHLEDLGGDRVRITGVRGEPAPDTAKLGIVHLGGFRNAMTMLVPPPDIEAKAQLLERQLRAALPAGTELHLDLVGPGAAAARRADGVGRLRVAVTSDDPGAAGRAFSSAVVELALASYPGFTPTAPPGDATPFTGFWPSLAPASVADAAVEVDGETVEVPSPPTAPVDRIDSDDGVDLPGEGSGCCASVPLGRVAGARSGDKGADANIGVWARTDAAYEWLERFLTASRLRGLLPETDGLAIDRHLLPNLRAINFVVHGILGEGGVAASTAVDPQAKTLAEFLRSRVVEVPIPVLEST